MAEEVIRDFQDYILGYDNNPHKVPFVESHYFSSAMRKHLENKKKSKEQGEEEEEEDEEAEEEVDFDFLEQSIKDLK